MNQKIIVDTSIWIEYFKNNEKIVQIIENGLNSNSIYITGPVVSELLQGVKTEQEFDMLSGCIDAVPYLECTAEDWIKAGRISFILRRKGITVPLTDVIISAVAIRNNAKICTLDYHFSSIDGVDLLGI